MFGSRTVLAAIGVITLGAIRVFAQAGQPTEEYRAKYQACMAAIYLMNPQATRYYAYDDPTRFNVSYGYDPKLCDSTIPVNYIRLQDYESGDIYTCTRQQFVPERTSVFSTCAITL